ncbi:MAG TPA: SAM-dependent chlorinase/fluorinase [Longimicrobiaceae bacterium]
MIATLLTDFGLADHYVGVMKGVLLSADPRITLVDLGHDVPPGDIEAGAFVLLASYPYFPPGTVHVAVVDPGVGTARRPIVAAAGGQLFVAPDNGLLGYVVEREPDARVFHVTEERWFRHPMSTTFHGRDVFAPVGAALAMGTSPESLGPGIADMVRLAPLRPEAEVDGTLRGRVLQVDRFGNCITSFTAQDLGARAEGGFRLRAGTGEIRELRRHFAGARPGAPFAIWGSSGFLEVAVDGGSAAAVLGLGTGHEVRVEGEA